MQDLRSPLPPLVKASVAFSIRIIMLAVMLNIKGEENGFHDHLNHDKEHHQVLLFKLSAGDDHLVPGLCIAFPQDEQLQVGAEYHKVTNLF